MPKEAFASCDFLQDHDDVKAAVLAGRGILPNTTLPDVLARKIRAGYAGGITCMDEQAGRVLDQLDALKQTDSTIVMFTADHGWGVRSVPRPRLPVGPQLRVFAAALTRAAFCRSWASTACGASTPTSRTRCAFRCWCACPGSRRAPGSTRALWSSVRARPGAVKRPSRFPM